jgi:hypothetical protein
MFSATGCTVRLPRSSRGAPKVLRRPHDHELFDSKFAG